VFEITSGELLSVPEQVTILAGIVGKPIRCVEQSTEAALQGLIRAGIPAPVASAVGQSFEAVRNGRSGVVKDTVEKVTGKRPKTYDAWARAGCSFCLRERRGLRWSRAYGGYSAKSP
jgi:(4-alkanoyl-5-oxo-2,5-dihydrofuran-3-yl)methyl phosphate reductase